MNVDILRNKAIRTAFGLSLLPALLPLTAVQGSSADSVSRTARSVWKIYGESSGVTGTAFAVGPREFITNAHVVKDLYAGERDGGIVYLSQGDRKIEFNWAERVSLTYDIALFSTVERVDYGLELAKSFDPSRERSLYAVGYPQGSWTVVRQKEPIVAQDSFVYEIPSDKFTRHGNMDGISGAPIVDSEGNVVAILAMSYRDKIYGVKSQHIDSLRKKNIGVACLDLNCFQGAAMDEVFRLINEGNPVAQFQLGSGRGYISQDIDLGLMIRLGKQGFLMALRDLCDWYKWGRHGISKNQEKARYWCRETGTFGR